MINVVFEKGMKLTQHPCRGLWIACSEKGLDRFAAFVCDGLGETMRILASDYFKNEHTAYTWMVEEVKARSSQDEIAIKDMLVKMEFDNGGNSDFAAGVSLPFEGYPYFGAGVLEVKYGKEGSTTTFKKVCQEDFATEDAAWAAARNLLQQKTWLS